MAAETDVRRVHRAIGRLLAAYQQEKRGPTLVAVQTPTGSPSALAASIPQLADMPLVPIHVTDADSLYAVLDWQRLGAKVIGLT
jgi:DNA polymerase epsilon subunit 1